MDFTPILKNFSNLLASSPLVIKDPVPFTVMILSPHPDDECIVGSLALRLMKENNAHIVNVAVTLGSKKERQKTRLHELEKACEVLEMELVTLHDDWKQKEKELKSLIQKYQPDLIIAPHTKDHHPTHIKTGELLKSLISKTAGLKGLVAWSEFWAPQASPNVMIEVPEEILALQMRALTEHAGEIERNPYHLRLPGWMMDNVRRGAEVIGGKGEESPTMAYGVLYKVQKYSGKKFTKVNLPYSFLTHLTDLGEFFKSLN